MEIKNYTAPSLIFSNNKIQRKVEYFKHNLELADKAEMLKVLDTVFLTTGTVTKQFETAFAEYIGTHYAVGVMSCTHALELCLRYFNIGPGDEVITTPLSYVATANAIESVGAKPVFVDVAWETANIDVSKIEAVITTKTKAILPVHLYGQMCNMRSIQKIAAAYNLKVIEDAAHCIEGEFEGKKIGSFSDAACVSFYATKNITSGEGGAIVTNNEEMNSWLLQARSHGISSSAADRYTKKYQHYDMEFLGMKCNMSNMQASLLIHQLQRINILHARRKKLFEQYEELLSVYEQPRFVSGSTHAYHLYSIWVKNRDQILENLYDRGIGAAVHYRPAHVMTYYKNKYGYKKGDFPIAEYIGDTTISLPLYPLLLEEEVEYVCNTLNDIL